MYQKKTERLIFVEFNKRGRLEAWSAVTEETNPAVWGRPAWTNYLYYDCETTRDGRLLYDMSGSGGDTIYVEAGKRWWAAEGIEPVDVAKAGKRVKRLPKRFLQWPFENSLETPIVHQCTICGPMPDEIGDPELGFTPCPHLKWDTASEGWEMLSEAEIAERKRIAEAVSEFQKGGEKHA